MKARTAQWILGSFVFVLFVGVEILTFTQHGFWGLLAFPGIVAFFFGFYGLCKLAAIASYGKK